MAKKTQAQEASKYQPAVGRYRRGGNHLGRLHQGRPGKFN
ncbi:Protein of unknown function [Lactobacillus delbrueckii subsp. lactis]|nr:Protein of unknown function [Lactobacillus delbrueckii subsp. lactis]